MKKRLLFVADKPDWAYEFMIKTWVPFLQQDFDCYICYQEDYFIKVNRRKNWAWKYFYNALSQLRLLFYKLMHKDEKVYFISEDRKYYFPEYSLTKLYLYDGTLSKSQAFNTKNFDLITEMAYYFQIMAALPFTADKKIVGIFTDVFPHEGPGYDIKTDTEIKLLDRQDFFDQYLKNYGHIIVGGGDLVNNYRKLTAKVSFVYGIFGEAHFQPNEMVGRKAYLTVGWTGTPDRPMKGFRSIIEPALKKVLETGRLIKLKTKFTGPYEALYHFYSDVDLVIIASNADSGPSMYAEASLSNVPAISTRVGLPQSFLKDGINGNFIERDIDDLAAKLIMFYDDRAKLIAYSHRVREDYLLNMRNSRTYSHYRQIVDSLLEHE